MSRIDDIIKFLEAEHNEKYLIEPEQKHNDVKEKIFEAINLYKPEVIVKAGIGSGSLLVDIANSTDAYITVVEPSFTLIKKFLQEFGNDEKIKKIKFINGDFHEFPLDYYAADLLICIDYLDFFDSSETIDEFKRALKFGGIFLFSSVILNDNDIDGLYDDLIRMIFPIHNDFYIADDIDTFLNLKEFDPVNNFQSDFKINLRDKIDYFQKIFKTDLNEKATAFIEENKKEFTDLMSLNENLDVNETYYIGVFKRRKQ